MKYGTTPMIAVLFGIVLGIGFAPSPSKASNITPGEERLLLSRAAKCFRARQPVDLVLLRDLLRMEEEARVPRSLRGMLLAAACYESGYSPLKKGDGKCKDGTPETYIRRHKRCLDGGKVHWRALGIVQQRWYWEYKYGVVRTNPRHAGRFWIFQVHEQATRPDKTKKYCPGFAEKKHWLASWVRAIRYKSPTGRCWERTKHWTKVLKTWHRDIGWEALEKSPCTPDACMSQY